MTLTVSSLIDDIKHTLFKADVDGSSALDYINQAGQHLANCHEWQWMVRRSSVLRVRASITLSTATWVESTLTLTQAGAFTNYVWVQGDEIEATDGTGVTPSRVRIRSRTSANAIVLDASISTAAIDLVAGDIEGTMTLTSVALPADFGTILAISATDGLNGMVAQTTLEHLLQMRTGSVVTTSTFFWAAVVYATSDATINGVPVPLLELWPNPNGNNYKGLTVYYRSGWAELTNDNEVIPVPTWMETCFRQLVRAFARGYEHEQSGPGLAGEVMEWEQHPVTIRAMERDGMAQQHYGALRGGAVQRFLGDGVLHPLAITNAVIGP